MQTYTLTEIREGTGWAPGVRFRLASDEEYNGSANRETWAFALWLNNDKGSQTWAHELVRERVADVMTRRDSVHVRAVGEALVRAFLEMGDDLDQVRTMREDIGSTWRIDEMEIGKSFAEDALEDSTEYRIEGNEIVRIDAEADR